MREVITAYFNRNPIEMTGGPACRPAQPAAYSLAHRSRRGRGGNGRDFPGRKHDTPCGVRRGWRSALRRVGPRSRIADLLAMPGIEDVEIDIPRTREPRAAGGPSLVLLLDTDVVSELRKVRSGKADPHVAAWADSVDAADLYLSVIALQELETGVLLAERRDLAQGAALRAWLNGHVLPAFAGRILVVDAAVAQRSTRLHVPDFRPLRSRRRARVSIAGGRAGRRRARTRSPRSPECCASRAP